MVPWQVPQASEMVLAPPHRLDATEALVEETLLRVLKLRLSLLWLLKLAMEELVVELARRALEPRKPGQARRALGPQLRPQWLELLQALRGASTRKAARAWVALRSRACSLDKWRGKGSKHIGALSSKILSQHPQSRRNCGEARAHTQMCHSCSLSGEAQ